MAKKTRTRAQLLELLGELRKFLESSAASYDGGFEAEAKRLAVTLRTLLHDTQQSTSLLQLLKVKDKLSYTDTAHPIVPGNLAPTPGLVMMRFTSDGKGGGEGTYIPIGMDGPLQPTLKPFPAWWTRPVVDLHDGGTWTRKQLVLALANQEGGAHVDPALNHRYEALARENILGFKYGSGVLLTPGGGQDFEGNVVAAAVRQIATEMLDTLSRESHLFV